MVSETRLPSEPYVVYVRQLLELQVLMAAGLGESDEAEVLREDMMGPWARMSERERGRARGLSADLYMLTGEEVTRKVDAAERARERLGPRLRAAWEQGAWDELLAFLRLGPDFLDRAHVAYLRGRCWAALGHHDVALLFFDHAARLNPHNVNYPILAIEELIRAGRVEQALQRAGSFSLAVDAQFRTLVKPRRPRADRPFVRHREAGPFA